MMGNKKAGGGGPPRNAGGLLAFDQPPPVTLARLNELSSGGSIAKFVNLEGVQRKWLKKVPTHVQEGTSSYLRIDATTQRFPCSEELSALPVEVQETVKKTSLAVLHWRLLPILVMWMRRRVKAKLLRAALSHSEVSAPPSAHFLSSLPCFTRWEDLGTVVKTFIPTLFVQDEVIIHRLEEETNALSILGFGFAVADNAPNKIFAAPSVLGKITVHSQHKQPSFVRVASPEALVWTLNYQDYHRLLRAQPPDVLKYHMDNSVLFRERHLKTEFQELLLREQLVKYNVFRTFESLELEEITHPKMVPKVFKPGGMMYRVNDPSNSVVYLLRGTIAMSPHNLGIGGTGGGLGKSRRGDAHGIPVAGMSRRGSHSFTPGSSMHASMMSPAAHHHQPVDYRKHHFPPDTRIVEGPCVIGNVSWIHATKRHDNVCAVTMCDTVVLPKDSMKMVVAGLDTSELMAHDGRTATSADASGDGGKQTVGKDLNALNSTSAGGQRSRKSLGNGLSQEDLKFLKYVPYVRSIPLLAKFLPPEDECVTSPLVRQLAEAVKPIVFAPRSTIVSSTQVCDSVIFVLSGRALIVRDENERRSRAMKLKQLVEKELHSKEQEHFVDDHSISDTPQGWQSSNHASVNQFRPEGSSKSPPPSKSRFGDHISGGHRTQSPVATPTATSFQLPQRSKSTVPTTGGGELFSAPPLPVFAEVDQPPAETPRPQQHQHTTGATEEEKAGLAKKYTHLAHGECIGFTLLHPHKWRYRVVASDTVEGVQISYDAMHTVLSKFGLRKKIAHLTQALVNPSHEPDESLKREVLRYVSHLKNPPMYSVEPPDEGEPTLCRCPTETSLARLPPIPLQNRLSTCVFGAASMTRFSNAKTLPVETGAALQPIVLGAHNKKNLPYVAPSSTQRKK